MMTTLFTHRILSGFGDPTDGTDWVAFSILWDGDPANMPGWEQPSHYAVHHIPGSDRNIVQLLGNGPLSRTFRVLCEDRGAYADLCAHKQTQGSLRVPARMNEVDAAVVRDLHGDLVADIPEVVLLEVTGVRVWVDGAIEAAATFWRSGRT